MRSHPRCTKLEVLELTKLKLKQYLIIKMYRLLPPGKIFHWFRLANSDRSKVSFISRLQKANCIAAARNEPGRVRRNSCRDCQA